MARIATASIRDHLSDELLAQVARAMAGACSPGFIERVEVAVEDAEIEPFLDWDEIRGHGRGYFAGDSAECASRRVDLRGPTDLDPGPLPMEEAPTEIRGRVLYFASPA